MLKKHDQKHKNYGRMVKYLKSHANKYNPSQAEALREVSEMHDD